jgi:ABC-2 type transport system permease protein
MTWRTLRKYLGFFAIGWSEALAERGNLYGAIFYLPVLLGVFSSLWRAAGAGGIGIAVEPRALVWYLATTEWIVFSTPQVHFRIADEVRRGDVVYQLTRPVSYLGSHYARAVGQLCLRAPVVGVAATSYAYLLSGPPPVGLAVIGLAGGLGLVASLVWVAFYLLLGLSAFWVEEIQPLHWVWQKATFILGGLMLPLAYCPPGLQRFAAFTPFPSFLYGPASLVLGQLARRPRGLLLDLACWLALAVLLGALAFRRARSRLVVSGG